MTAERAAFDRGAELMRRAILRAIEESRSLDRDEAFNMVREVEAPEYAEEVLFD